MKKATFLLLLLYMLTGCMPDNHKTLITMRNGLDSINERNRNDMSFTPDDVLPYADYFNRHGDANDKLLANYLLGRSYYERGESPMALNYYQKAIECADTTAADCDYAQMSRVYSQMTAVFYDQSLYRELLTSCQQASKYAMRGGDTLTALICYELQSLAYRELHMTDSAIYVVEDVARSYSKHGFQKEKAIALGGIANTLIRTGNLEKAREYMQKYELESGLFNENGDIEKGREIYYYPKGLLYLKTNRLDSAEYWFRKELRDGKDFNNQNGGALGLAMVYDQRHMPDSANKYYQYAYAMNDSMYTHMHTEKIGRMQAMYNYSRHQETARRESERAAHERVKWQLSLLLLLLGTCIAAFAAYHVRSERRENTRRYQSKLEELEKTQSEVLLLRDMTSEYSELTTVIEEKEKEIIRLKNEIQNKTRKKLQDDAMTEKRLKDSKIYQLLVKKSKNGQPLSNEDLSLCRILVIEFLPELNDLLLAKQNSLNKKEFDLCILFRLGILSKEASNMLNVSPARVSQMCTSVLFKLFNITNGGAKDLIAELMKFH